MDLTLTEKEGGLTSRWPLYPEDENGDRDRRSCPYSGRPWSSLRTPEDSICFSATPFASREAIARCSRRWFDCCPSRLLRCWRWSEGRKRKMRFCRQNKLLFIALLIHFVTPTVLSRLSRQQTVTITYIRCQNTHSKVCFCFWHTPKSFFIYFIFIQKSFFFLHIQTFIILFG